MAQSHPDPLIGKVLNGRFRVVDRIGAGGMGRVYKAVQEPIDRLVALKVLNPRYDGQKDPGFERRFFLEASMTAKLKHPNTITVHDYGRTDDGIYYIAMEYLEGETLQSVLRRGPIAWPRALAIAGQVARSLREAHKLGMVHRDLKPANIMILSAEGTAGDLVKVLDFGLVKSFLGEKDAPPEENEEEALENESLTQEGVLLGSPLYMAPEQARREADGRTDIYALGTVLFQCIAGRTPFQGRESIDILVKQVRETPPQLRQFAAKVPQEVNDLVMHCLEKAPDARFQTMEELLEAMRVALDGHGMSGTFIDPRFPTSPSELDTAPSVAVVANDPRVAASPTSPIDEGALSAAKKTEQVTPSKAPKLAVAVMAVALVVGVSYSQLRSSPAPLVDPTPAIENVSVTFQIESEPSGATVHRDGVDGVAGTTPFSVVVTQPANQTARLELTFSLDGYEEATVMAQGTDGTVPVKQVLKKLPDALDDPNLAEAGQTDPLSATNPDKNPPVKKPAKPPAGFKADPYQ